MLQLKIPVMCQDQIFYVYQHVRLDTGTVFYVGKGHGRRAFDKRGRNRYWTNITKKTEYLVKIIEDNLFEQQAFEREIELIRFFKSQGMCEANLAAGGLGPKGIPSKARGIPRNDEVKRKISATRKGTSAWNKGRTGIYSDEQRTHLSKIKTGIKYSEESRRKRSLNTPVKRKIQAYKAVCTQFRKPGTPSIYVPGELCGTFESIMAASKALDLVFQHISRCLSGKRNQCKGYIFKYVDEGVINE